MEWRDSKAKATFYKKFIFLLLDLRKTKMNTISNFNFSSLATAADILYGFRFLKASGEATSNCLNLGGPITMRLQLQK